MRIVYKSETPNELVFDSLKDCLLHEKSYYIAQMYKCYCRYIDYKKLTHRKKFDDYLTFKKKSFLDFENNQNPISNTKKRKYYWQERLLRKAALKESENKLLALKKEWHGYIKLEKKTRAQLANILEVKTNERM